jgi:hypothetical protein
LFFQACIFIVLLASLWKLVQYRSARRDASDAEAPLFSVSADAITWTSGTRRRLHRFTPSDVQEIKVLRLNRATLAPFSRMDACWVRIRLVPGTGRPVGVRRGPGRWIGVYVLGRRREIPPDLDAALVAFAGDRWQPPLPDVWLDPYPEPGE